MKVTLFNSKLANKGEARRTISLRTNAANSNPIRVSSESRLCVF